MSSLNHLAAKEELGLLQLAPLGVTCMACVQGSYYKLQTEIHLFYVLALSIIVYKSLYNNQMNVHALNGQSAMVYCTS